MPWWVPGDLTDEEAWQVSAYILRLHKVMPVDFELRSTNASAITTLYAVPQPGNDRPAILVLMGILGLAAVGSQPAAPSLTAVTRAAPTCWVWRSGEPSGPMRSSSARAVTSRSRIWSLATSETRQFAFQMGRASRLRLCLGGLAGVRLGRECVGGFSGLPVYQWRSHRRSPSRERAAAGLSPAARPGISAREQPVCSQRSFRGWFELGVCGWEPKPGVERGVRHTWDSPTAYLPPMGAIWMLTVTPLSNRPTGCA